MNACCTSTYNWGAYGRKHHTLHMASDITEGSILYIGPKHREATVQEITIPFNGTASQGVILEIRVVWRDGGSATVQFIRSNANKKDLVTIKVDQKFADWDLRGHTRNKHKPSPQLSQTTNEHLAPFL